MKKLFLSAISIALAASAYAIPNTFSEGDVISAEQMNENFESLINSNLLRSISVNCGEGETINGAIESGYNDITVSGTCNENLLYTVWRDSKGENEYQPSNKLAPRYLKLSGATADARIVDASANTENTISVNSGATLVLENITVSGGRYGVVATRNSNLLMTGGVAVEGFTERGIRVDDSSYLGVDEGGLTLTGAAGADRGIHLATGSSGWIENMTVSGVNYGLYMFKSGMFMNGAIVEGGERGFVLDLSSHLTIYGDDKPVSISNVNNSGIAIWSNSHLTVAEAAVLVVSGGNRGIEIGSSSALNSGGSITISQTSDRAISVSSGGFSNWNGSVTISELIGGRGIDLWQSKANINNLKLLNFSNTGSGWNPAIRVGNASALNLNNSEVSGETDSSLINIDRSSMLEVNNSNISGTAGDALIYAGRESLLDLEDSTVSGTAQALIGIDRGSTLQIESGTLSGTIEDALIGIHRGSSAEIRDESELTVTNSRKGINVSSNSHLDFKNSQITGTVTESLIQIYGGASAQISDSTMTISSDAGISIYGSSLEVNNLNITGEITDNLFNIREGSNAKIWDSTIKMTGSENWNSAILLSAQSSLTLGSSNVESNKEGLSIENNSFAEIRENSSVTSSSFHAARLRGSARMRVRSGSELVSTGATAVDIRESSTVLVNGDGTIINRTDEGYDVELGFMSSLTIWGGTNLLEEVNCWGRSLVFDIDEMAITQPLPDSCKE